MTVMTDYINIEEDDRGESKASESDASPSCSEDSSVNRVESIA